MPPGWGKISQEMTDVANDRVAGKSNNHCPGVTRPELTRSKCFNVFSGGHSLNLVWLGLTKHPSAAQMIEKGKPFRRISAMSSPMVGVFQNQESRYLRNSRGRAPWRGQGSAVVRLWGDREIEADAELVEHFEGVEVGDVELVADVGDVDSFPGVWAIRFVRHHDGAMD